MTGAASGMGLLASRELAAAGAKVVMCDVNEVQLDGFHGRNRLDRLDGRGIDGLLHDEDRPLARDDERAAADGVEHVARDVGT